MTAVRTRRAAGPAPGRVPTSTYRLQLRAPSGDEPGFTLRDAAAVAPYLARLGVGAVYLSPICEAAPGSTHGYDVVDPTRVAEGLGGEAALRELRERCRELGLGLVVDIVPNHLGVDPARADPWWWDVLRRGADSPYASYFDLDTAADNGADGRIALPVLGSPEDLDAFELETGGGEPVLRLGGLELPVAPGTEDGTPREVLDRQHYRPVHWREPLLGYRRFFTVTGLAGLRQDLGEVFEATHAAVARWVEADLVDGVRVDHPDGLADPVDYARRLRRLVGPDRWIVVEKILAPGEVLDPAMPVEGTTGYDALRLVDQVLVDPAGREELDALALEYCGTEGAVTGHDLEQLAGRTKRELVERDLAPELARLTRVTLATGAPGTSEAGLAGQVREVLLDLVARTPYYRADYPVLRGTLPALLDGIRAERDAAAVDVVGAALSTSGEVRSRLAQVTGAATAKAEEDRLFYRLGRLVSSNEVGGSPGGFGLAVGAFHLATAERAATIPATMTTLATHDTKRGPDVRARMSVLAQVPGPWAEFVRQVFAACPPPATDTGYLLLQNLVGAWPEGRTPDEVTAARFAAYAEKAVREAGLHTTWTDNDTDFERAVAEWISALCTEHAETVGRFVTRIAPAGRDTSLAAMALHLLSTGVPDVYQGTEIWEDSLVDPDNRRAIDFVALDALLGGEDGPDWDTHPKLALTHRALGLRRRFAGWLPAAEQVALPVTGPGAEHALAFHRPGPAGAGIVVVVRLHTARVEDAELAEVRVALPDGGAWEPVLGGEDVAAGSAALTEVLAGRPVAVLARSASQ